MYREICPVSFVAMLSQLQQTALRRSLTHEDARLVHHIYLHRKPFLFQPVQVNGQWIAQRTGICFEECPKVRLVKRLGRKPSRTRLVGSREGGNLLLNDEIRQCRFLFFVAFWGLFFSCHKTKLIKNAMQR